MLELTSDGQPVVLAAGTSVPLELNSPLFDEDVIKGDYSFSFTVPAAPNGTLYGFPELPESAGVRAPLEATLADDGVVVLAGTQRVRTASARGYTLNLVGGLSQLAAELRTRKLASFALGGQRRVAQFVERLDGAGTPHQVPGLVLHANDVVQNPYAYDYVFAPVSNDGRLDADNPQAGAFVNGYAHVSNQANGLPGGGSFTYDAAPGAPQYFCPFPWLRYVLASVFAELGLVVDAAQFLPGELGRLVLGSAAVLPEPTHLFTLADVVPDLSVAELLQRLKLDLGLVVLVSPQRVVRTAYWYEVLASADYLELTALAEAVPELERAEATGRTLTYTVDEDDALTKDLVRDFTGRREGAAVATATDLPAAAAVALQPGAGYVVPREEVRLVLAEDAWYASTVSWSFGQTTAQISWTFFARNYRPVPVLGGGEERPGGAVVTLVERGRYTYAGATLTGVFPTMRQRVFRAGTSDGKRSAALRLWFWRGLQPSAGGGPGYPLVTPYNRNADGLRVGSYSLKLDGADGSYERLLKGWLQLQGAPVLGKATLRLSVEALAAHDPARKVRIAGVDYLVRKLAPVLPLTKAVPVELWRV